MDSSVTITAPGRGNRRASKGLSVNGQRPQRGSVHAYTLTKSPNNKPGRAAHTHMMKLRLTY